MKTALKIARIIFEILGALAIILCVYFYYALRGTGAMRNPCTYSQMGEVKSPDGKMVADKQLQTCPYGTSVQVRLGTEGDEVMEYEKIISLQKANPAQIELLWTGSRELQVTIPKSAELLSAYGYQWGVTINRRTQN